MRASGLLLGVLVGALVPTAATPAQAATVETIREATGANAAAIQATVDAFRVDLGSPNNGASSGSLTTGRREINWDGVPDGDAAPGRFPGDFFNKISPRGAVITTPGTSLQVSADAVNPAVAAIEFGHINATYPTAFQPFSVERLFTALGSNLTTVRFFIAGTGTPAGVRGFGALFTDVDVPGPTKIEYFDDEGELILSRDVLATPGDASLSFLGVKVSADDPVAEVRITSGAAAIGPNDVTQTGGNPDVVVMDDFIYGEPNPLPAPPAVQFAAPSSSGAEGATASVTVTRTGDLDESAQAAFETRDGTARGGEDYLPAGGTVSFAAGETTTTIPVTLLSDAAVDDGETFAVALTIPAAGTTIGSPSTATVAIADVPAPPPAPPDRTAPSFTVKGFPQTIKRAALLRRGLSGTVRPNESAAFEVAVLGTVRRVTIAAAGDLVLGEARLRRAAGTRRVRVKISSKLRRAIGRRAKLRLRIVAIDAAGNRRASTRKINVRR